MKHNENAIIPNIKVSPIPIKQIVESAVRGEIDIPEFQRSFVWKPYQVRDLAESICDNFPIGTILSWYNPEYMESRLSTKERQSEWIIDGQQRTTAFCLIAGRKPKWYREKDWQEDFGKYETWVDVTTPFGELLFETRKNYPFGSKKWVSIREICKRTETELSQFADDIKKSLPKKYAKIPVQDIETILVRLNRLFESEEPGRGYSVQKFVINHDLEEVAMIFTRLNSGGTPVKETDTILAFIGAHHRGWVKKEFIPFQDHLNDEGFDFDAGLLVRTITGIGVRKTRIKDVPKDWWRDEVQFMDAWKRTKTAVSHLIKVLSQNYGILSADILPTHNALLPMFLLYDEYPEKQFKANKALYWFLLATRAGRYGGASTTALDEDIKAVRSSRSFDGAINALIDNLEDTSDEISVDDVYERYTERFLRLIYYLSVFENKGTDWMTCIRLGYNKSDGIVNKGFQPEWHHFFPRAYLKKYGKNVDRDEMNCFANIVVLGQRANRTISSSAPKDYMEEMNIGNDELRQQFIPIDSLYRTAPHFRTFIKKRAKMLSEKLTGYFQDLNR